MGLALTTPHSSVLVVYNLKKKHLCGDAISFVDCNQKCIKP